MSVQPKHGQTAVAWHALPLEVLAEDAALQVSSVQVHAWGAELRRPLQTAVGTVRWRRAVLVGLSDREGRTGWGEAAPLQPWSDEGIDEALLAAECWGEQSRRGGHAAPGGGLPATVRHALRCALLDLIAQQRGQPLGGLLTGERHRGGQSAVPVHRLVRDADEASSAAAAGLATLKIKVGAHDLEADVARVEAIAARLREELAATGRAMPQLRLDANGAWGRDTAARALERFSALGVTLCEQPVPPTELDAMAWLRGRTRIAIAADEACRSADDLRRIVDAGAADVVVLKPMLLGGPDQGVHLAAEARAAGLGVYVTTMLDGGIGRLSAWHAAAAIHQSVGGAGRALACGLDTAGLLRNDLAPTPAVLDGRACPPQAPGLGAQPDFGWQEGRTT